MRLLLTKEEKKIHRGIRNKKDGQIQEVPGMGRLRFLSKGQTTVGERVDFPGSTTLLFCMSQDLRERLGFQSFIKTIFLRGTVDEKSIWHRNTLRSSIIGF